MNIPTPVVALFGAAWIGSLLYFLSRNSAAKQVEDSETLLTRAREVPESLVEVQLNEDDTLSIRLRFKDEMFSTLQEYEGVRAVRLFDELQRSLSGRDVLFTRTSCYQEVLNLVRTNPSKIEEVSLTSDDVVTLEVTLVDGEVWTLTTLQGVSAVRAYDELKAALVSSGTRFVEQWQLG